MTDRSSPFRPKDWLANPFSFGRSASATLEQSVGNDFASARTAWLQHCLCLRIRRQLQDHGMTLKQLSVDTGIEYQYLTKLLRGDLTMQLHHLAAIDSALPGAVFDQIPSLKQDVNP
ncbi:helix-turn-helix domain-containing protein [Arthrobacter crystallopoietes]|uniref:helix-turn-helix domain-containing protein n=1 Tax=Crystallibacter crystallopoietes TaxID=37928 RepID=UPI001111392D|nr:helix-turn-helix transcriptional regulator [Arthrobacter crystallopoietes]